MAEATLDDVLAELRKLNEAASRATAVTRALSDALNRMVGQPVHVEIDSKRLATIVAHGNKRRGQQ